MAICLSALVALLLATTTVASVNAPQNTPTPLALKASATPHPGFGTTGRVTVADDVHVADMITTEDGSLLVAGTLNDEIYVAKFLPDGSLDTSFGVNGKAIIDTFKPYEINAMARLSTGEIWVAGVPIPFRPTTAVIALCSSWATRPMGLTALIW